MRNDDAREDRVGDERTGNEPVDNDRAGNGGSGNGSSRNEGSGNARAGTRGSGDARAGEGAPLRVTVGDPEDLHRDTLERIQRAADGETLEDARPVLTFEDYEALQQLIRPVTLELLATIVASEPESIRALADAVERDYRDVHRNLTELAEIGVVEFVERGPGRPRTPRFPYSGLEIAVPLTPDGSPG